MGKSTFPNDPEVEFSCLTKFHTSDLCPKQIALSDSPLGRCVLYQHLSGPWLENESDAAAKTLVLLHNMPLLAALRQSPIGSDQIRAHAHEILKNCPTKKAKDLVDLQPDSKVQANGSYAIIHTDPVPANIILSNGMAKLIDWHCPAIGSPQEDLCHFLSPAMQWLCRGTSLTDQDQQDFLHFYHDRNPNAERYFLTQYNLGTLGVWLDTAFGK